MKKTPLAPSPSLPGMLHTGGRRADEVLLNLVRRDWNPALPSRHIAALRADPDWAAILRQSARHAVHGLLVERLTRVDRSLPEYEPVWLRASALLRILLTHAALLDLERDRVVHALVSSGSHPVLLKGAALRLLAYNLPVHRPMQDIDVLVDPGEFGMAVEVLEELGYRTSFPEAAAESMRKDHYHFRFVREPFTVEVHWALCRSLQPYRLDPSSFLQNAVTIDRPGRGFVTVPSPEHMILHLVAENLGHGTRLGRLVDIDRLMSGSPRPQPDKLLAQAIEAGLEVRLAVDLRLCQRLLATPVPEAYVERLGLSKARLRTLARADPESWAFTNERVRVTVAEARRHWCVADRFRPRRWALYSPEDPLGWVWRQHPMQVEREIPSRRVGRVGKRLAYQLWIRVRAIGYFLSEKGRRRLRFWGSEA